MSTRSVESVAQSIPTIDGAGVFLRRAFGYAERDHTDPFLQLDHLDADDPEDFVAGFPWHPHRGVQILTYLLEGVLEHIDSLGNRGQTGPGDVHWVVSGGGVIHQEIPDKSKNVLRGFQLWVNMPQRSKMTAPISRIIPAEKIPVVEVKAAVVRVLTGSYAGAEVSDDEVGGGVSILDVAIHENHHWTLECPEGRTVILYVFEGSVILEGTRHCGPLACVRFSDGEGVTIATKGRRARVLVMMGVPLHEPIAWRGPVVMNTQEELTAAFKEYQEGTFLK
jgi:quercetin 2,3-dioxygenase